MMRQSQLLRQAARAVQQAVDAQGHSTGLHVLARPPTALAWSAPGAQTPCSNSSNSWGAPGHLTGSWQGKGPVGCKRLSSLGMTNPFDCCALLMCTGQHMFHDQALSSFFHYVCTGQQRRGMFIQTQSTPNPNSLMFQPGRDVMEGAVSARILNMLFSVSSLPLFPSHHS